MSTPATLGFVRDLLRDRSGIVLDSGKEYLIESRLVPLAQQEGFRSVDEVVAQARTPLGSPLRTRIVEALTTHETSFFRDIYPFEAMKREILPKITPGGALHIWCAACSTGQEPYSLAMMIRESFPQLANGRVSIYATDLSEPILARAREGRFRQLEVNRGLPAAMLVKHFDRDGTEWKVKPAIRAMVTFGALNLLDGAWTMPRPDVVFIRNVLIYFDVETKKTVLRRVRQKLAPNGVLFLGGAETATSLDDGFERVAFDRAFYYRARP